MKFRLRIDGEDQNQIEQFCKGYAEYVIVFHVLPHGNPHFHAYINAPMVMSAQTFRMRVKRVFNPATRNDYSVKECDEDKQDEYISYLFNTKHGNVATLVAHNLDDTYVNRCKESAKDISTDFQQRQQQRRTKSVTLYDIAMEVDDITKDDNDLIVNTIRVLHRHLKVHDDFLITKIITTIQSKRDINFVVERIRRRISNL